MNYEIPEYLKMRCPNCGGEGKVNRRAFSCDKQMISVRCSACKSRGWIWTEDQQEMAERIAHLEAKNKELQDACAAPATAKEK